MEPHPVRGVEFLAEGDHIVVGPDPLAVGEPLERRHPVVHLADEADEEGLVAEQPGNGVDDVRRDYVDEEAEYAVLQLAVLEGAIGWPEIIGSYSNPSLPLSETGCALCFAQKDQDTLSYNI